MKGESAKIQPKHTWIRSESGPDDNLNHLGRFCLITAVAARFFKRISRVSVTRKHCAAQLHLTNVIWRDTRLHEDHFIDLLPHCSRGYSIPRTPISAYRGCQPRWRNEGRNVWADYYERTLMYRYVIITLVGKNATFWPLVTNLTPKISYHAKFLRYSNEGCFQRPIKSVIILFHSIKAVATLKNAILTDVPFPKFIRIFIRCPPDLKGFQIMSFRKPWRE